MNSTPMTTATAAGAAAVVAPIVAYLAALLHLDMPAAVQSSIVVLLVAGAHWLGQLIAARTATKAPAPSAQAGFVSYPMLWMAAALSIAVCFAGCTTPPTQTQVQQITNACAMDKGLRPSVDVLLAIPGLAKPEEIAAVAAARAIVDPICANPSAPFPADPTAQITQATATVAGLVVQIEARKAAAK